jgi:surfactin synthase thioesterase subunit
VNRDELEAWRAYTSSGFSCFQFPGDHFYFRVQPGQGALIEVIRDACANASIQSNYR